MSDRKQTSPVAKLGFRDWCILVVNETRRLVPGVTAVPSGYTLTMSYREKRSVTITNDQGVWRMILIDPLSRSPAARTEDRDRHDRTTAMVAAQNAAGFFDPALAVTGFEAATWLPKVSPRTKVDPDDESAP